MDLNDWLAKWHIPPEAFRELADEVTHSGINLIGPEKHVLTYERKRASDNGDLLWRNNIVACQDSRGNFIRAGLANESKQMNENLKSSDLIGIRQITITPEMVGSVFGQFTSIECKRPGWKFHGTKAEIAQLNWIILVLSMGGHAYFSTGA